MGAYRPGALIGSLAKRRFGLLIYVLVVIAFGVLASSQGKPWSVGVWLLIGLWLLAGIIRAMTKTPT